MGFLSTKKTSPLLKIKRCKNADVEEDVQTMTMTGTDHQAVLLPVNHERLAEGSWDSGDRQTMSTDLMTTLNVETSWCYERRVVCDIITYRVVYDKKQKTKNYCRHWGTLNVHALNGEWHWRPVLTDDWSRYVVHVNELLVKGQLPVASLLVFNNTRVTQRPHMPQLVATQCRG